MFNPFLVDRRHGQREGAAGAGLQLGGGGRHFQILPQPGLHPQVETSPLPQYSPTSDGTVLVTDTHGVITRAFSFFMDIFFLQTFFSYSNDKIPVRYPI